MFDKPEPKMAEAGVLRALRASNINFGLSLGRATLLFR